MKNKLIFILLLFFYLIDAKLDAQTIKGQYFVSGSLGLINISSKEKMIANNIVGNRSSDLGFTANFGLFIKNNTALVVSGEIQHSRYNSQQDDYIGVDLYQNGFPLFLQAKVDEKSTYNTMSLSVGLRRYFFISERLSIILAGNLGGRRFRYMDSKYSQYYNIQNNSEQIQNQITFVLSPAITYFITPHFSVESFIGGLGLVYEPKSKYNYNSTFSAEFKSSNILTVGFGYYF